MSQAALPSPDFEWTPDVDELARALHKVMAAQHAYSSGRPQDAMRLVISNVPGPAPDRAGYRPYLGMCVSNGKVASETDRLKRTVEAAREAYAEDNPRLAQDLLFGRAPLPSVREQIRPRSVEELKGMIFDMHSGSLVADALRMLGQPAEADAICDVDLGRAQRRLLVEALAIGIRQMGPTFSEHFAGAPDQESGHEPGGDIGPGM